MAKFELNEILFKIYAKKNITYKKFSKLIKKDYTFIRHLLQNKTEIKYNTFCEILKNLDLKAEILVSEL